MCGTIEDSLNDFCEWILNLLDLPMTFFLLDFFKHIFEVIGPMVLKIMNSCLEMAMVPDDMKQVIVHPLLKHPYLDPTVLTNFRPVSNLPFMSKIS